LIIYAYPDFKVYFKVSNFPRVEEYVFKCLKFCKFLLSQTLNNHKVAFSFVFVVILMELGMVVGIFFVHAFLSSNIPLVLANLMSSYEMFIPFAIAKACLFCQCYYK